MPDILKMLKEKEDEQSRGQASELNPKQYQKQNAPSCFAVIQRKTPYDKHYQNSLAYLAHANHSPSIGVKYES